MAGKIRISGSVSVSGASPNSAIQQFAVQVTLYDDAGNPIFLPLSALNTGGGKTALNFSVAVPINSGGSGVTTIDATTDDLGVIGGTHINGRLSVWRISPSSTGNLLDKSFNGTIPYNVGTPIVITDPFILGAKSPGAVTRRVFANAPHDYWSNDLLPEGLPYEPQHRPGPGASQYNANLEGTANSPFDTYPTRYRGMQGLFAAQSVRASYRPIGPSRYRGMAGLFAAQSPRAEKFIEPSRYRGGVRIIEIKV